MLDCSFVRRKSSILDQVLGSLKDRHVRLEEAISSTVVALVDINTRMWHTLFIFLGFLAVFFLIVDISMEHLNGNLATCLELALSAHLGKRWPSPESF